MQDMWLLIYSFTTILHRTYQGGFMGLGVFEIDCFQGQVLLQAAHVCFPSRMEQGVALILICGAGRARRGRGKDKVRETVSVPRKLNQHTHKQQERSLKRKVSSWALTVFSHWYPLILVQVKSTGANFRLAMTHCDL